ncbi:hypothetical protein HN446_01000 [bacterium]|jgi:hypothetical protein|nr:hypothetical protein [bacterium]
MKKAYLLLSILLAIGTIASAASDETGVAAELGDLHLVATVKAIDDPMFRRQYTARGDELEAIGACAGDLVKSGKTLADLMCPDGKGGVDAGRARKLLLEEEERERRATEAKDSHHPEFDEGSPSFRARTAFLDALSEAAGLTKPGKPESRLLAALARATRK